MAVPTRFARISRILPLPFAMALLAATATAPGAQTFTRILSATNPVLADVLETGGSAWRDIDGDGDLDLFVAHGNLSNQNNALFINLGGFAFQRVVTAPVGSDGGSSIGGCWGDFDGDGHLDLFVTNRNNFGNFLYQGGGDTTFTRLLAVPPATNVANSNDAAWLDIDGDGDLDLHVVNFVGDDFLFLNSGPPSWSLDRVTPAWLNGTTYSIMGVWADVDLDGDLDEFIVNAGDQNDELWLNQGGAEFTKREIMDGKTAIGASWGDFDDDGDMDLVAIGYLGQETVLYRNEGAPNFDLVKVDASVFPITAGSGVGSAWGDVDNDGDLDLLVAFDNGQNEALFLNSGPPGYTFTRVNTGDLVSAGGNSFGCALVDIDDDGDLDAFVGNRTNQADFLFRNDSAPRSWLTLRMRGVSSVPSAEGARVAVLATLQGVPRWQYRQVLPVSGYNTQVLDLHFGLDDATTVDQVVVDWPSGVHQVLGGLAVDQRLEIVEDLTTSVPASPGDAGDTPLRFALEGLPGGGVVARIEGASPGIARVELLDVSGRVVASHAVSLGAGVVRIPVAPAGSLAPGIYFGRLRHPDGVRSATQIVLR